MSKMWMLGLWLSATASNVLELPACWEKDSSCVQRVEQSRMHSRQVLLEQCSRAWAELEWSAINDVLVYITENPGKSSYRSDLANLSFWSCTSQALLRLLWPERIRHIRNRRNWAVLCLHSKWTGLLKRTLKKIKACCRKPQEAWHLELAKIVVRSKNACYVFSVTECKRCAPETRIDIPWTPTQYN